MKPATLRLGMLAKRHDPRALKLRNLVDTAAVKVPATHTRKLGRAWQILGNDRYGDCAFAAMAHAAMLWGHVERHEVNPTADDVVRRYLAYTGGPDLGTDPDEMLALYRREGVFGGPPLKAYMSVDPANCRADVPRVDYVFGTALLAFALPAAVGSSWGSWPAPPVGWQQAQPWQPYSWGGHMVMSSGYTTRGVKIVTWGKADWLVPWEFCDAYLVGVWACVTTAWLNANRKSPQGLDVARLEAELARLS